MNWIIGILESSWQVMLDASLFILIGFVAAALIRAFISSESIVKYIGGRNIKSVLLATLFGIPLPICSCGVVPTALALRKQGASKPATISFLITTPESSIDSIAITYGLIDLTMTIFRPIAAFITGLVAGIGEIIFGEREETAKAEEVECLHCHNHESPATSNQQSLDAARDRLSTSQHHSFTEKLKGGLRFAFVELLEDISRWFLVGILISGAISFLMPASFIENYLSSGVLSLFIMLGIGLPLYVCATASTPIAATLILKGLNPGAALVFLLVGPATNAASLTVIAKMLGKRSAIIYVVSIAVCAIILGLILNQLYSWLGIDIQVAASHAHEMIPVWLKWAAAVPLTIAMLWASIRK